MKWMWSFIVRPMSISFSLLINWQRTMSLALEKCFVLPPYIHQRRFLCISSPPWVFSHLRRRRVVATLRPNGWPNLWSIKQSRRVCQRRSIDWVWSVLILDRASAILEICTLFSLLRYCECTVILRHSDKVIWKCCSCQSKIRSPRQWLLSANRKTASVCDLGMTMIKKQ